MKTRGLIQLFAVIFVGFSSISVVDETYEGKITTDFNNREELSKIMQATLDHAAGMNLSTARTSKDPKCIATYSRIYSKPVTDFRVVLGYKDHDRTGNVTDGLLRDALIDRLLAPCPRSGQNIFACGFHRDADDADLFYKEIQDPTGKAHAVKMTVIQSSYDALDDKNRGPYQVEQTRQSRYAAQAFLDGVINADIVLYNGHSRGGGGPDFGPARLNEKKRTDYRWYREHRPGLKKLIDTLQNKTSASVIGLISCLSARDFLTPLEKAAPKTGFLVTQGMSWWSDETTTLIGAINALLGEVCEPDFDRATHPNPAIDPSSRVYSVNLFR